MAPGVQGLATAAGAAVTTFSVTTFYCGIDVAKRNHMALVLDGAGQVVKPAFAVPNTRAGFDA